MTERTSAFAEPSPRLQEARPSDDAARLIRDVQSQVRDLLRPNVRLFWADLLLTSVVIYASLAVYFTAPNFSFAQIAAFVVGGLAMYRSAIFTHEIAHRPAGSFIGFTTAWNALFGIPFFMPTFLYGDHKGHHTNHAYGTHDDPEYLFLAAGRHMAVIFLLLALLYPVFGFLRFLILTPLSILLPPVNRLVWRFTSSLYVMNQWYRRPYDAAARSALRWSQELLCSALAWTVVVLLATHMIAWQGMLKAYLLMFFWIGMNQIRTLSAHRYANDGEPMTYVRQLLDTNTFDRGWLAELWAPLGLRYHALHHLVPSMPYHAMGEAHRRLMQHLPNDSPYRDTVRSGVVPVITTMIVRPTRSVGD